MNMGSYTQSQTVNFLRIENNLVYVLIRDVEKGLEADSRQIEKIKQAEFFDGEKLILLYSSKTVWELRKYQVSTSDVDKYFRKD